MLRLPALLALCCAAAAAAAQPLTGAQPDAGFGFAFTIPEGWVGAASAEGYVIGHQTVPGMVLVAPKHHGDLAALQRTFAESTDDGTSSLRAVAPPQTLADGSVRVEQRGTVEGAPVKVVAIAKLNPHGGNTANLMALAAADGFSPQLEQALLAVHRSVRYTAAPRTAGADGPPDAQWKQRLAGARLTYMDSYNSPAATEGGIGGGYSIHRRIDLCPEGHFKTDGSASHSFSGADVSAVSSGSSAGEGRWSAVRGSDGNALLRLRFNDGRVAEYRLGWQEGKTYLNGERWYRTTLASDGPEYAPACP
ncbi:MAG: hypothetical protein QY325_09255 [Flavobacteriales bacterium]|nr:MAG: hypothetical protein QY325_09255 [Flavobacteriales bacterium]